MKGKRTWFVPHSHILSRTTQFRFAFTQLPLWKSGKTEPREVYGKHFSSHTGDFFFAAFFQGPCPKNVYAYEYGSSLEAGARSKEPTGRSGTGRKLDSARILSNIYLPGDFGLHASVRMWEVVGER
ncbi:DNA-binding protein [Anopheles sinensis]|uniref:DNA-binding protein n=1 Tax=Anopheles sinensis TaxID=74873 RepID=A0A084W8E1_ANOSI|nr:DNA-binding protein [Anopheles sinensis]